MNSILDAVLAVSLVFAVFALIASGIQESIASWLNLRGKQLFSALEHVMGKKAVGLLNDPLVSPLTRKDITPPAEPGPAATEDEKAKANKEAGKASGSYLPSWVFSAAVVNQNLVGLVTTATTNPGTPAAQQALADEVGGPLADVIKELWATGAQTKDALETALATWYDSYMERVNGWYKRQTRWILFFIALVVALLANVDAVSLTRTVINNAPVRTVLAQEATNAEDCPAGSTSLECGKQAVAQLPGAQLGLFWSATCPKVTVDGTTTCAGWTAQHGLNNVLDYVLKVLGLLLGAFAISLGAPFWFDLIGRGKALKSAGEKPATVDAGTG